MFAPILQPGAVGRVPQHQEESWLRVSAAFLPLSLNHAHMPGLEVRDLSWKRGRYERFSKAGILRNRGDPG